MKAHLMYSDRDFDPKGALAGNADSLMQDLELDILFEAMAAGDGFLLEVCKRAVLRSLAEPAAIRFRQSILVDCIEKADVVRRTYAIAVEALEGERKIWGWSTLRRSADGTLHRALEMMRLFVPLLRSLREIADVESVRFKSEGFTAFWATVSKELSEEYLRGVEDHLRRLVFPEGVVISAALGEGNKGSQYILREPPPARNWWERFREWHEHLLEKGRSVYAYEVADRDEGGHQALAELRSQGIARAAEALGRSAEHILNFFMMLRSELAFYVSCLNLRDRLTAQGESVCLPEPVEAASPAFSAHGLYDVALALELGHKVVVNDVHADEKSLVMITGANRGGKSTFLRSVGQAQLMMQCGMFTASDSLRGNVCSGIFTHYKRVEDATMRSGKLEEELQRMSSIVDHVRGRGLVLFNESFGSTNEREGSAIAQQIVRALLERNIKVFYVTHMFELASGFHGRKLSGALFLRAERLADGQRTFRVVEGDPLSTGYGQDLYRNVFANELQQMRGKRKAPERRPA